MRFSVWELLLILVIVLVLFGGTRLRNLGSDVGAAIRGFRDAMREGKEGKDAATPENPTAEASSPKLFPSPVQPQAHTTADTMTADPLAKKDTHKG